MSSANLLNLNVDTLFEQHSVPEIDIIHKKVLTEIESKREELRTMVGERYRDLLKAADTIAAMQENSRALIAQVSHISANCRTLNEQQLIGFKHNDDAADLLRNRNADKEQQNYFSTMVQIKLLTALPELIWSHIDQDRFYSATELFIFSRHISTGLQLDANNKLMQHLPVAKKQWEILKPFHVTIKQHVVTMLEREELSTASAVDCLLSLLLLEKCNLNSVFKTFLQLRTAAFLNCLTEAEHGDVQRRRAKQRILASLKILNGTIEMLSDCFLENGLLYQKLAEHTDPDVPPIIALMDSNDAQFAYLLPEIISNFRPKFEPQTLDETQARVALEQWHADTTRIVGAQLKELFVLVTTMSTIQDIKTEANSYRKHLNITPIVAAFKLSESLDFYTQRYMPLINQRVRDIIKDSWEQAMQQTFEALEKALQNASTNEQKLWTEHANELPLSLEEALSEDRKIKKLLMKTKGYDSDIISLCAEFDRQLASIVSEMNVLLEEQNSKVEDKLALVEFLREIAQQQLTHFLSKVKSLQLSQQQRQELLIVVRSCAAIVELCPHLKICFCQQSNWRQWLGNVATTNLEHWQRMCLLLEEETFNFWQLIIDSILAEYHCAQYLTQAITHDIILEDFAHWETIRLEQKDEQDNLLHSNIRIPNQPRISLQCYLFTLIRALNTIVPQTLPTKVLHAFNSKLLAQLLQHYAALVAHETTATSQNVALQLYFDLKFLQSIFAVTRDERAQCEQFQTLQNVLKDKIDPFDFELFVEHIKLHVKRAVSRLNCQFGVLTPQQTATTATSGIAAAPTMTHEKDPNVLSLSSCGSTTLWFPLLPIITPNAGSSAAAAFESKRVVVQDTEKDIFFEL